MDYEYNDSCSSMQAIHAHSMNIQDISYIKSLQIASKKKKKNYQNKKLSELQKHKGNFKSIKKYVHSYFVNLYMTDQTDYNIKMIDDILGNESTHLVAEFKDYLIIGDDTEFLQKSYSMKESKKYLPKIYDYYKSCSVIFPNYVILPESKYIYKNIRRKQKVLDNQQEQDDKKEKIKKGDLQIEDNDEFFTSKTFYSILDQTNTSNVKLFFGINTNNKNDNNETPNNIVAKLELAENQAIKNKMNLMKQNNKNKYMLEHFMTNTFDSNKKLLKEKEKEKKNHNMNSINGNNNIVNRYIYIRNNNITNKSSVLSYMTKNSAKTRSNTNINHNTYVKTCLRTKLTPRIHVKSSSNVIENDVKNMNISKSNKKYRVPSNNNMKYNNSNKYFHKFSVNPLFPNKKIISKVCNTIANNTNSHSKVNILNNQCIKKNSLNFNSINFLKRKKNNNPLYSVSPSSVTIETNSFRRKMHINESNSTRNIINNKILNIKDKIFLDSKKNNHSSLKNGINYNNNPHTHISIHTTNTLPTERSDNSRIKNEKFILTKNNSSYKYNVINKNNFLNNNNNNTYKTTYPSTYENNIKNIYKINSTSNIINNNNNQNNNFGTIGSNNSSRNDIKMKMNCRENSSGNIMDLSKPYLNNGKPKTIELETIKVTKRKKSIHPKMNMLSDSNNSNGELIDNRKNNIGNNYFESIVFSSIHNEDNNGGRQRPINTINYVNKKQILFEDINKKKNAPIKKEIIININGFNGYNTGTLTSRNSKNFKNIKKNNGDINFYNSENKIYNNKTINNIKKGNYTTKNDTIPVKIKKFYDIKSPKNTYSSKNNDRLSKSKKK